MPEMITAMSVRPSGDLLIASHHGINNFDFENKELTKILDIEPHLPNNRCNDGASDAKGRFWIGTMQNNISPEATDIEIKENSGNLYCVNHDLSFKKFESDIGVSNTLAWSPDNTKFYFTDTLTGIIFSYDFDLEKGEISNKQEFAKHDRGYPDGSTVDSEGGLWSCRWGGSSVIRFDPNGKVDEIVEVPVESVTNCTFGGENLDTLFITTARWGMSQEQIDNNPSAGGLFSVKPGVTGVADNQFGG
jgi:sugar lactone lactonase YvrE